MKEKCMCPFCDAGCLVEKTDKDLLVYSLCDFCGVETATVDQTRRNLLPNGMVKETGFEQGSGALTARQEAMLSEVGGAVTYKDALQDFLDFKFNRNERR